MEATLSTQRSFVNALGARARELIVRPRVNKGGVGALQVPADVRSRIAGVDSGTTNLASLVSTVSLVVLDMIPSTVFMECITGDVPVVAIVPEGTVFTPLAAEFYEEFTRLGILHGSPEDAARFVARLNTRSWWNDVSSRACVRDYQHTFCNRDLSLVRRARKSRLERIE
jgi:putative transferase (TIGR04331 family)